MIATLVLGLWQAVPGLRLIGQTVSSPGDTQGIALLITLLTFGLVLLLTLLASRGRNGAALVLLMLLFLAGLPEIVRQLSRTGLRETSPFALLGLAGQIAAFAFAATGPARRWFRRAREPDIDHASTDQVLN